MWQKFKCWIGCHAYAVSRNKADGFAQKICKFCGATTNKITYEEYQSLGMR